MEKDLDFGLLYRLQDTVLFKSPLRITREHIARLASDIREEKENSLRV